MMKFTHELLRKPDFEFLIDCEDTSKRPERREQRIKGRKAYKEKWAQYNYETWQKVRLWELKNHELSRKWRAQSWRQARKYFSLLEHDEKSAILKDYENGAKHTSGHLWDTIERFQIRRLKEKLNGAAMIEFIINITPVKRIHDMRKKDCDYVYLIQNKLGIYKIGITSCPATRFCSIKCETGSEIIKAYSVALMSDAANPDKQLVRKIEGSLHSQFREFKSFQYDNQHEWFEGKELTFDMLRDALNDEVASLRSFLPEGKNFFYFDATRCAL